MLAHFLKSLDEKRIAIAIAVLVAAVFGPFALRNAFVSIDDDYLIYNNPAVQSMTPATIRHVFTSYDPQLYIPLTFVSYQLNALLFGLTPVSFHVVNVILHAANAVLVLLVVRRLSKSLLVAGIAATLFAIHPLQTEAVLWAASRKDLLSGFFFLLSTLAYLHADEGDRKTFLRVSIGLFFLALLSKVSIIVLPAWLLAIDWMRGRAIDRSAVAEKLPYVALAIVFGVIAVVGKSTVIASSGSLVNALLPLKSAAFYLQKMVWPTGLSVIYPYVPEHGSLVADFAVPVVVLLVVGAAFVVLFLKNRRFEAFCIATYAVLLAPSFSTFWKNGYLYFASDRYAYLAAIGAFALFASFVSALASKYAKSDTAQTGVAVVGAALALVLVIATRAQAGVWKDSKSLYRNVLMHYPESVMASTNLGLEMQDEKNLAEARRYYEQAIAADPSSMHAYFNLASLENDENHFAAAEALYVKIVDAFGPRQVTSANEAKPLLWLAGRLDELGKPEKSLQLLEKLTSLAPSFPDPQHALGEKYRMLGREADSVKAFEAAVAAGSENPHTYYYLTEAYSGSNRMDDAIKMLERGVALDPDNQFSRAKLVELKTKSR